MRDTARAIVFKEGDLLVMKRNRNGDSYYCLVGGGIESEESKEQSLLREIAEETGLIVDDPKLAVEIEANQRFGKQYVYFVKYVSGEPRLSQYSVEAELNKHGDNSFMPTWISVDSLGQAGFRPVELIEPIKSILKNGLSHQPIKLTIKT